MFSLGSIEKEDLVHVVIGGGICFLIMFLLSDLIQTGLEQILIQFGVIGVIVFEDAFYIARNAIIFGTVYLVSGFCAGLYTGYNIEENLKVVLFIPSIIGFTVFIFVLMYIGNLPLSNIDFVGNILLPLLGNIAGAYLGGYTMNWPSQEESPAEFERLTVELGK